jgi:hypothetical protein
MTKGNLYVIYSLTQNDLPVDECKLSKHVEVTIKSDVTSK